MTTWVSGAGIIGGVDVMVPNIRPPQVHAAPIEILRSVRVGATSYQTLRPARASGIELVRVTFASTQETAAGQCKQNLVVNGQQYVRDLDVYAATGAQSCVVRDVYIAHDTESIISLGFSASPGQAQIAAIEFLDGAGGTVSTPLPPVVSETIPTGSFLTHYVAGADYVGSVLFTETNAYPLQRDYPNGVPTPGFSNVWAAEHRGYLSMTTGDKVADIIVDDGYRLFVYDPSGNAVAVANSEAWIQQSPRAYAATFHVATAGLHLFVLQNNNTAYTATISMSVRDAAAPPPTPPTGSGAVQLAVYEPGYSSWSNHFANLVNHDVPVAMIYWNLWESDTNGDFLDQGSPTGGAFLAGRSDRRIILGVSPINGTHDFGASYVVPRMQAMAAYINARATSYGFTTSQIVIRFGYEVNGNWMPWGVGNPDGNGLNSTWCTQFITMWNNARAAFRAICPAPPWDWCTTPWETGTVSFAASDPGVGNREIGGGDLYDDWEYADPATNVATHMSRLTQLFDWCDSHGAIAKSIDEWAVCKAGSGNNGGGDNPAFIHATFVLAVNRACLWILYFNMNVPGNPEPGWTLADAPASLAQFKTDAATYAA